MSAASGNVITRLEGELRALWAKPEAGETPMARVCTMNLVVVAHDRALRDRYVPVVDEVTSSIPARALVVAATPGTDDVLDGSATAVCYLYAGRKICSERVLIDASGRAERRVASAVSALLVPELPTALVWLGRLEETDELFNTLAEGADRIIVDSEFSGITSVAAATRWVTRTNSRAHVVDLAWTRLAPWHELLARIFDGDALAPLADTIEELTMVQASSTGVGSPALLMLGWIATRLGWRQDAVGLVRADGRRVAVSLGRTARPRGVAEGTLACLKLRARGERGEVLGDITRALATGTDDAPDADVIDWKRIGPGGANDVAEQRVRLGPNKAAKWLERTLHRPARDEAFEEAVAFAAAAEAILGGKGGKERP